MNVKEQIEKLKKLITKSEMKINIEQQFLNNLQAKLSHQEYILENFGNDFNEKAKQLKEQLLKTPKLGDWTSDPTLKEKGEEK